jgi:hypothetical protein
MTEAELDELSKLTARRIAKTQSMQQRFDATKERWKELNANREKLDAERALNRRNKSPLLDFVNDLVHRPPNREQMRQLKELLEEQQKATATLIALISQYLSHPDS